MAWSTPSSRSTGDLITAAIWNQDAVANVIYVKGEVDKCMIRLDTDTLTSAGEFNFTSISASYASLRLIGYLRGDRAAALTDTISIQFNGDTGNNYYSVVDYRKHNASLTTVEGLGTANGYIGHVPATTAVANVFAVVDILIPNYANTSYNKSHLSSVGMPEDSTTVLRVMQATGYWASTAAINEIDIIATQSDFDTGSRLELYGLP